MKRNIFTFKGIGLSIFFSCFIGTCALAQSNNLVVVDSEYSDKEKVISQVTSSKILSLEEGSNPWKAIRERIAADREITTVHLFVEASYNAILMGGVSYDKEALNEEFELSMLEGLYQGTHLQLLVYNCNLGASEEGMELLRQIGERTYMNVGTSTNCTSIFDSGFVFDFKTRQENLSVSLIHN